MRMRCFISRLRDCRQFTLVWEVVPGFFLGTLNLTPEPETIECSALCTGIGRDTGDRVLPEPRVAMKLLRYVRKHERSFTVRGYMRSACTSLRILSVCLSVCLSDSPSVPSCPSVCLCVCLYVCMCTYMHLFCVYNYIYLFVADCVVFLFVFVIHL